MGSRKMSWLPVAISLVVTYTSGITQMGQPAEIYQHGIQYIMSIIGAAFGIFVPVVTFVPLLFKLKLTSTYEARYFFIIFTQMHIIIVLYCIVYLYSAQYLHILQDSKRYLTNRLHK